MAAFWQNAERTQPPGPRDEQNRWIHDLVDRTQSIRRIFLIGPTGAGKTTVGRIAAAQLGLEFRDLDEALETRCGAPISLVFELEGEAGFRQRETELLEELTMVDDCLLATGAGCVLDPGNRRRLAERGLVVYLKVPVALQAERLQRDRSRPLLDAPDWRERLKRMAVERDPLYAALADLQVEGAAVPPQTMAKRLLAALRARSRPAGDDPQP